MLLLLMMMMKERRMIMGTRNDYDVVDGTGDIAGAAAALMQ